MNRRIFIIREAVATTYKEWRANVLFIGVLVGFVLLLLYCISSIQFLYNDLDAMKYNEIEDTVEIGFLGELVDEQGLIQLSDNCKVKKWTLSAIKQINIPMLNNSEKFLLGIDENYWEYHNLKMLKGNLLDFSNELPQCLVGKECAIKERLAIGDYIHINEVSFEVVGIVEEKRYQDYIIIPYGFMGKLGIRESIQQTMLATGSYKGEIENILKQQTNELLYCEEALTLFEQTEKTILTWIEFRIITGWIGAIFASGNVIVICLGKIQERKKKIGLMRILGLDDGGLFLSLFTENMIISIITVLLAVFIFIPVTKLLGIYNVLLLNSNSFIMLLTSLMLFSLNYAAIVLFYIRKNHSIDLVREGE